MGKYIHLFETEVELESAYFGKDYIEPWVSYTEENEEVKYNKQTNPYQRVPLTFVALGDGNFTWELDQSVSVLYSKNGGEWLTMNNETTIPVVSGDTIAFKGTNTSYDGMFFGQSAPAYNLYGNIMSITDGDSFLQASTLARHAFQELFTYTRIVSAENLILPVTTLADYCYAMMFQGCSALTAAPELPATVLADYCYNAMFNECKNLTTAPELPATVLADGCYNLMFGYCHGLSTSPVLPATTLTEECYAYMFGNCRNLTGITCLATDISATDCTTDWVSYVASSGTFTKAASMSDWETGANGIPTNWTVQDAS